VEDLDAEQKTGRRRKETSLTSVELYGKEEEEKEGKEEEKEEEEEEKKVYQ